MDSSRLGIAVVATLYFLLSYNSIHAQNLTAVKCNGRLPTGRYEFPIVYDQDDSIYIFGGYAGRYYFDDVIKYSISEDTTEIVAQLPQGDAAGGAVINRFRNIFYLAGYGANDIYQYFPDHRSFDNVSSFKEDKYQFATISPAMDTALLLGGNPSDYKSIISLNLNTMESQHVGGLQEAAVNPSAIWVEEQDAAYIFELTTIQKYVRSSRRTEKLSLQPPIQHIGNYGAVWDGKFAYLFGEITGGNPRQSILQFNPVTEAISVIPVEGYVPVHYAAAVYIEKLNRIYTFGGWNRTERYSDEIHYIDLDPLNPPPTTRLCTFPDKAGCK